MTLDMLAHLANLSHHTGDQEGRVRVITKVLASYDRQGRAEDALMARLGLALAQEQAGDAEGALRTYEEARDRAEAIGRPELTAQVVRNWGLALSSADRPAEAEPVLREAVAVAERGSDPDLLGRSRIALGIFLQHQERLDEAGSVVEEGLSTLDVADRDAITGRSHLGAIKEGRSCGCGDMGGAVTAAFREFVLARLPRDLWDGLEVSVTAEDGIQIQLGREPSESELELLRSLTNEFRSRLA